MIFLTTIALGLISLSCGVGLIVWSLHNKKVGSVFAKIFGYIIFILSLLLILFTLSHGFMHFFGCPFCGMNKNMMQMHQKMMGDTQNTEKMNPVGNMYNMEHLQNMGSQQSMEHMQTKEGDKGNKL